MNDTELDDPPTFDVGVAIAKKKKAKQQQETKTSRENSSLWDFVYGASLYVACLAIPTLLGLTGLFGNEQRQEQSLYRVQEPSYYEQASAYVCENVWSYWCSAEVSEEPSDVQVHAPDAEWTDVAIVAVLSLSMALIRLLLVHLLVPRYLAPKRLEALVRCKSASLLSSSYSKSLTPQTSKKKLSLEGGSALPSPPLFSEQEKEGGGDELSSSLHGMKQSIGRYVQYPLQGHYSLRHSSNAQTNTVYCHLVNDRHVEYWELNQRLPTMATSCKIPTVCLQLLATLLPSFDFSIVLVVVHVL